MTVLALRQDEDLSIEQPNRDGGSRSARLATILRQAILAGTHKLGDALPAERELMTKYTVSRATVREALRDLAAQGLIETRRGRTGGSYVCGPSTQSISSSLDLFISGHTIKYSDLAAVREAIEPIAAAQAALNRAEEDVHTLLELTRAGEQSVSDLERFSALNLDWHMAVIRASQNPLFVAFMGSISSALYAATTRKEFDVPTRKLVAQTHRKIFEAIRDGDAEAAQRRMGGHVNAYGRRVTPPPATTKAG